MTMLFEWLTTGSGRHLLAALGHSLWLGALLIGLLAALLRWLPLTAATRYSLLLAGQLVLLLSTIAIWTILDQSSAAPRTAETPLAISAELRHTGDPHSTAVTSLDTEKRGKQAVGPAMNGTASIPFKSTQESAWSTRLALWLGLSWMLGAAGLLVWRLWQHLRTGALVANAEPVENHRWLSALAREKERLSYAGKVMLRRVGGLASPAVYGIFRPVILLPQDLLETAEAQAIRAILAHELAHLRRLDSFTKLAQQFVEALLFFNPFVWLLSRWSEREREAAADALALGEEFEATAYSEVLLQLAARPGRAAGAAVAAAGDRPPGLRDRIQRLVQPSFRPRYRLSVPSAVTALVFAVLVLAATRQAAQVAAETLTQADWMQRISEFIQEDKPDIDPPQWNEDDRMIIRGRVLGPDAELLEGATVKFRGHAKDKKFNHTFNAGGKDGAFKLSTLYLRQDFNAPVAISEVSAVASAPGHGMTVVEKFPAQSGEFEMDIQFPPSMPARIIVQNEAGEPVPFAKIDSTYWHEGNGWPGSSFISDDQGRVKVNTTAGSLMAMKVTAKGYQMLDDRHRFTHADPDVVLTLSQGIPVKGRVVDAEGEPIAGALIHSIFQITNEGTMGGGTAPWSKDFDERREIALAETGPDGRFTIMSLRPDTAYWLVAGAEGYQYAFRGGLPTRPVNWVDGGYAFNLRNNSALQFTLQRPPTLRVKMLLPHDFDPRGPKVKASSYHTFSVGKRNQGSFSATADFRWHAVAMQEDGSITFERPAILPTPLTVRLRVPGDPRGLQETVREWTPEETLLVDFSDDLEDPTREREVVVRLSRPADAPPVEGTIRLEWSKNHERHEVEVPVVDNVARHQVFFGERGISIHPDGLVGETFRPRHSVKPDRPEASTPVEVEIDDLHPAGAIRVRFDNLPPSEFPGRAKLETVDPQERYLPGRPMPIHYRGKQEVEPDDPEAVFNPVPVDVPLRLNFRRGNLIWSDEFILPAEERLVQQTIVLPDGEVLGGRLLDPNGDPLPETRVRLNYQYPSEKGATTTSHFATTTGENGEFRFENVNFDLNGTYYLNIAASGNYQVLNRIIEGPATGLTLQQQVGVELRVRLVVDETGEPISGRVISAKREDGQDFAAAGRIESNGPTGSNGYTTFDSLAAKAEYHFWVRLPHGNLPNGDRLARNHGEQHDLAEITGGTLTLRIPETEWNNGKPVKIND